MFGAGGDAIAEQQFSLATGGMGGRRCIPDGAAPFVTGEDCFDEP
jgi:hypothetical protein